MFLKILYKYKQFNLKSVICLLIVKWSNSSIQPIDGILIGTTVPSQGGPGSNGNDGVLHIPPKLPDKSLTIRCS